MSVILAKSAWCDGCDATLEFPMPKAAEAISPTHEQMATWYRGITDAGWVFVENDVYCPGCAEHHRTGEPWYRLRRKGEAPYRRRQR